MHIEVLPDVPLFRARTADAICSAVRARRDAWLGVPTGTSPIPTYEELAVRISARACDVSQATACAIDEFCAPSGGPGTNAAFYRRHLGFWTERLRCPEATTSDPAAEIGLLANDIQQHGGLDLCILGIGVNGHIAFNEPGSSRDSEARVVDLADSTLRAHAEAFGGQDRVPRQGMTLGIADLLQSKSLLVLATGASKATIVAAAIQGPETADVPASWLRGHADVTWMLDAAAATGLDQDQRN